MKAKQARDFYTPPIARKVTTDEESLSRCVDGRNAELKTTRRRRGIIPPGAPERNDGAEE